MEGFNLADGRAPTIEQAATSLRIYLKQFEWLKSVSVGLNKDGKDAIFVKVTSNEHKEVRNLKEYMDFPVVVKSDVEYVEPKKEVKEEPKVDVKAEPKVKLTAKEVKEAKAEAKAKEDNK